MSLNALDTALVSLAAASSALERTSNPSLKDIKEARDKAKGAHEVLDASVKLLERGVYTVAAEPPADTPLFDGAGEPAPGTHTEPAAVPLQVADPKHPLDLFDEGGEPDGSAQDRVFDDLMLKLENAGLDEGLKMKAWKKANQAWSDAWNAACAAEDDQAETRKVYDLAVFALEVRRPFSWDIPTEKEVIDHQRRLDLASGE